MQHDSQDGLDVIIEGGSKAEQYILGAIVSKALTEAGYNKTEHHDKPGHAVPPTVQIAMYPSLLAHIRQDRPDFLNTPVIVSAYHAPAVPRERRAIDRVQARALETALSQRDAADTVEDAWNALSLEQQEDLIGV